MLCEQYKRNYTGANYVTACCLWTAISIIALAVVVLQKRRKRVFIPTRQTLMGLRLLEQLFQATFPARSLNLCANVPGAKVCELHAVRK